MPTYFDPRKDSEKHLPESERRGIYPSPHPEVWEQEPEHEQERISAIDDLVIMITVAVGTALVIVALVIVSIAVVA